MDDTQKQIVELQADCASIFKNILLLTKTVLELWNRVEELERCIYAPSRKEEEVDVDA